MPIDPDFAALFLTDARDSCRSRHGWVSGEFFACKVSSNSSGVVELVISISRLVRRLGRLNGVLRRADRKRDFVLLQNCSVGRQPVSGMKWRIVAFAPGNIG